MTSSTLQGVRVAILVTDGFEQSELLEPRIALDNAGAATFLISPTEGKVKGWNDNEWGNVIPVDIPLKSATADDFHALFLPGGVMSSDHLRVNPQAVQFVKHFMEVGKPVAAICHGSWTILEAGAVRGRTMTSWPSLKTDNSACNVKSRLSHIIMMLPRRGNVMLVRYFRRHHVSSNCAVAPVVICLKDSPRNCPKAAISGLQRAST
jgi:protease I